MWRAALDLSFRADGKATVLAKRAADGPLVVQKPLYPEGEAVCHAIVVHPPGGIAGGDELELAVTTAEGAHALLTTPGAAKWYRTAGPAAKQTLRFAVNGVLEWLPCETIVFDGARAMLESQVELNADARFIGWEMICLGRAGSGERFSKGEITLATRIARDGKLLWVERGRIDGGGSVMSSPVGLGGRSVWGTLIAAGALGNELLNACRKVAAENIALTLVPGVLLGRYLGDSSEEGMRAFAALWSILRPALARREAIEPRIWRT